mmetsp:Transcript_97988/g.211209  ORF Transcript_97988/g.211209 Transcript_97988/m.211209 type:complete len:208 (-) Transcript_97988:840-1463(-)
MPESIVDRRDPHALERSWRGQPCCATHSGGRAQLGVGAERPGSSGLGVLPRRRTLLVGRPEDLLLLRSRGGQLERRGHRLREAGRVLALRDAGPVGGLSRPEDLRRRATRRQRRPEPHRMSTLPRHRRRARPRCPSCRCGRMGYRRRRRVRWRGRGRGLRGGRGCLRRCGCRGPRGRGGQLGGRSRLRRWRRLGHVRRRGVRRGWSW